jgi:hypothetical protein
MTEPDRLLSVVYASTASEPFGDARLAELLAQSRASNTRRDLTGMLLYRNGRFVQVLEGPESEVRGLLSVIQDDPRHTGMRVLAEEYIAAREFSDWTMGCQPIAESREKLPEGFRSTFDDLEASGDPSATLRAVRELSLWFRVRSMQRGA